LDSNIYNRENAACGTSYTLPTEGKKRKEASSGGYPYRDTSVADTDVSPVSVVHRPISLPFLFVRIYVHFSHVYIHVHFMYIYLYHRFFSYRYELRHVRS